MSYSIGITTFSLRYDMVESLVDQIRKFSNNEIILCINGEINGQFDKSYREKILRLCLKYDNVFPIFFIEMRGLSKMWNTIASHSTNDNILMISDDVIIQSNDIFRLSDSLNNITLIKFNNSFAHFIINRCMLDKVGWFDEKLLGFGEEDGDITFRFEELNMGVTNLNVNGVINLVSNIRHNIKSGIGKYSKFNRDYMFDEKYEPSSEGIIGMFGTPHVKKMSDVNALPVERFFWENKNKLI